MSARDIIAGALPPETDRGLAGQIMDAAWPEYGGNMNSAEFWEDFGEGVSFALKTLAAAGYAIVEPGHVKMPETEDEAAGMAIIGERWLRDNAPHRLRSLAARPKEDGK